MNSETASRTSNVAETLCASSLKLLTLCCTPQLKREVLSPPVSRVHDVVARRTTNIVRAPGSGIEPSEAIYCNVSVNDEFPTGRRSPLLYTSARTSSESIHTIVSRSAGTETAREVSTSPVPSGTPLSSFYNVRPNNSSDSLQSLTSVDGESSFTGFSLSSSSTVFDEEEFLWASRARGTPRASAFMTGFPFMAAHRLCAHTVQEYKCCPRCNRVSVREFEVSDAALCTWCYSDGAAENSCWFCWRCLTATGTEGEDDRHYRMLECCGS